MTRVLISFAVLTLLLLAGAARSADDKVEATVYGPYFEKNTSGLKGKSSYLVQSAQKAFDGVFGSGFTTGKKPNLIPKDTFDKHLVVAIITRADGITTYKVEKTELKDGTLTLTFESKTGKRTSAKFHSPLVVTVPKKDVKSVEFVENGKKVETVKVEK